MKYLVYLCCLLPVAATAQTKADAQKVMNRFMQLYNAGQNDGTYDMISVSDRKLVSPEKNASSMKLYMDNYGRMLSAQYLGKDDDDPEHVFVFKVIWSKKGQNASSFTLDSDDKFKTFRLITSSPGIDKMMAATNKR